MPRRETLTDPQYWDTVWSDAPVYILKEWHPYFGRNGIFMKMARYHLGALEGLRVLEVGAGGANHRLLALSKWGGAAVSAIDYSPVGLRILTDTFAANGCSVTTYAGDVLDYDFGSNVFDVVVHWGVLEHFVDPVPILRACAARLPISGKLLCTMPNMRAYASRWWRRYSPDNWALHVLHSNEDIARGCAAAGLTMTDTFFFGLPALKMAPWQHADYATAFVSVVQRALNLSAFVLPLHHGTELISSERGFIARKTGY